MMGKKTKPTTEAERLAAGLLVAEDREAVAADVADELRALHLGPYLDDLDRRAQIGALTAATEIGLGLLRANRGAAEARCGG